MKRSDGELIRRRHTTSTCAMPLGIVYRGAAAAVLKNEPFKRGSSPPIGGRQNRAAAEGMFYLHAPKEENRRRSHGPFFFFFSFVLASVPGPGKARPSTAQSALASDDVRRQKKSKRSKKEGMTEGACGAMVEVLLWQKIYGHFLQVVNNMYD